MAESVWQPVLLHCNPDITEIIRGTSACWNLTELHRIESPVPESFSTCLELQSLHLAGQLSLNNNLLSQVPLVINQSSRKKATSILWAVLENDRTWEQGPGGLPICSQVS